MIRMESVGYCLTGFRDAIGDGQDGPLFVTPEFCDTGKRETVGVNTRGSTEDIEACCQLAAKLRIQLDDCQYSDTKAIIMAQSRPKPHKLTWCGGLVGIQACISP